VSVNIGQGFQQFDASLAGLIPQNQPPEITSAHLAFDNGEATIVLDGKNFQQTKQRRVTFQTIGHRLVNGVSTPYPLTEPATIVSQSGTEIRVKAPTTMALSLADIYVTAEDGKAHETRSNVVRLTPDAQYAFVAMSAAGKVAVL